MRSATTRRRFLCPGHLASGRLFSSVRRRRDSKGCEPTRQTREIVRQNENARLGMRGGRVKDDLNASLCHAECGVVNPERCSRCSREIAAETAFITAGKPRCFRCAAMYPPLLYRSAKTAAIVGTILVAINIGPAIVTGSVQGSAFWRIPLNYLVPFCVATWGALSNSRASRPR